MTKICIPIKTSSRAVLHEKMQKACEHADVIEIWLGEFFSEQSDESFESAENIIDEIFQWKKELNNIPLLFTVKNLKEQGSFSGTVQEKKEIIRMLALRNADYIDIDYEFESDNDYAFFEELQRTRSIQNLSFQLILSAHFFAGTPSFPSLKNRIQLMQNRGADIVKIASMPQQPKDVLTMLRLAENLQRTSIPFIALSMGNIGKITRISSSLFGAEMTFASLEKGDESASGQMSVSELSESLKMLG